MTDLKLFSNSTKINGTKIVGVIILAITLYVFNGNLALAQQNTAIGVLNFQGTEENSNVRKQMNQQIKILQRQIQQEIIEGQKDLEQLRSALEENAKILTREQLVAQQKQYLDATDNLRKRSDQLRVALEKVFTDARTIIINTMNSIIQDLAVKYDLSLVIDSRQVIYSKPSIILDAEVLAILNEKLPSLELPSKISELTQDDS